jgi:hypothetical protein
MLKFGLSIIFFGLMGVLLPLVGLEQDILEFLDQDMQFIVGSITIMLGLVFVILHVLIHHWVFGWKEGKKE